MTRTVKMLAVVAVGLLALYVQVFPSLGQGAGNYFSYVPIAGKQAPSWEMPTPTVSPAPTSTPGSGPLKALKNPIISRGKPTFTNAGSSCPAVVDGNYGDWPAWRPGLPSPGNPAWLAVNVGSGYSRLLLTWTSSYNYNYNDTRWGAFGDYLIQTSADSTNGSNGHWDTVAAVTGNGVRQREHSFDFTGKSWVRLWVTAAAADINNGSKGIQIDEIDIHDISQGAQDAWLFIGDSITALSYNRAHQPSYAARIATAYPGYFPAMINAGIGFATSADGASRRIDEAMQLNPDASFVAIEYGSADTANNYSDPTGFRTNMQTIINKVKAAGKTPILARIPYAADKQHSGIPAFNAVIDDLTRTNGLIQGPDLYTWFLNNQGDLSSDGIHPNDQGMVSINRLWAESMGKAGVYK